MSDAVAGCPRDQVRRIRGKRTELPLGAKLKSGVPPPKFVKTRIPLLYTSPAPTVKTSHDYCRTTTAYTYESCDQLGGTCRTDSCGGPRPTRPGPRARRAPCALSAAGPDRASWAEAAWEIAHQVVCSRASAGEEEDRARARRRWAVYGLTV